jgi:hypothetical protein
MAEEEIKPERPPAASAMAEKPAAGQMFLRIIITPDSLCAVTENYTLGLRFFEYNIYCPKLQITL